MENSDKQPIIYSVFPIAVIFLAACVVTMTLHRRRQRRGMAALNAQTAGGESTIIYYNRGPGAAHIRMTTTANADDSRAHDERHYRSGLRSAHRGRGRRSLEGLNELGEAPPPYESNKTNGSPAPGGGAAATNTFESRDAEAGTTRPPEYITEPAPAIVRPPH